MATVEAAVGTLKMCQQAQDQLQNAINTVVKAEQQLRENTREVRKITLLLSPLFLKSPSFFLKYENMSHLHWSEPAAEEQSSPRLG